MQQASPSPQPAGQGPVAVVDELDEDVDDEDEVVEVVEVVVVVVDPLAVAVSTGPDVSAAPFAHAPPNAAPIAAITPAACARRPKARRPIRLASQLTML